MPRWTIVRTSTFKKRYKKKLPDLAEKVNAGIRSIVSSDDPRRFGRPKYGSLDGCYGYDVNSDCRILYSVDFRNKKINFLRVCDHKEVYP